MACMKPTPELRWEIREITGPGFTISNSSVLQQLWVEDNDEDLRPSLKEWRDVPIVGEGGDYNES